MGDRRRVAHRLALKAGQAVASRAVMSVSTSGSTITLSPLQRLLWRELRALNALPGSHYHNLGFHRVQLRL
jgi:hypothetical protein